MRPAFQIIAIAVFVLVNTPSLPAQSYGISDLGTLPGTLYSDAEGLNDLGQAVGASSDLGDGATLFSEGKATKLGVVAPDVFFVAKAINNSGQIAGYYLLDSGLWHAFLYGNGRLLDINAPRLFPCGSRANAMNNSGEVVGVGNVTTSIRHAFLYSKGRVFDLGTLGGKYAEASAINDSGEVVGGSWTAQGCHAFLYSSGRMTDLGVPSGAVASDACAINNKGQVVGSITLSAGGVHAALYTNGLWTDLGGLPGAADTNATGINDAGQIVGTSVFPLKPNPTNNGFHICSESKTLGFIYRDGELMDLNTLIPSDSGFTITSAVGINASGQILCNSTSVDGSGHHAVLLTPR